MSRDPVTALATEDVDSALGKMRSHGIRRLPVVTRAGQLDGLIAVDDIIEHLSESLVALSGLVAREQKQERKIRR